MFIGTFHSLLERPKKKARKMTSRNTTWGVFKILHGLFSKQESRISKPITCVAEVKLVKLTCNMHRRTDRQTSYILAATTVRHSAPPGQ